MFVLRPTHGLHTQRCWSLYKELCAVNDTPNIREPFSEAFRQRFPSILSSRPNYKPTVLFSVLNPGCKDGTYKSSGHIEPEGQITPDLLFVDIPIRNARRLHSSRRSPQNLSGYRTKPVRCPYGVPIHSDTKRKAVVR